MMPTKEKINNCFTWPLRSKKIIWSNSFKLFTDGGDPNWYWFPKYRREGYDSSWEVWGFAIYWLGREFNFAFGEDKHGLFSKKK